MARTLFRSMTHLGLHAGNLRFTCTLQLDAVTAASEAALAKLDSLVPKIRGMADQSTVQQMDIDGAEMPIAAKQAQYKHEVCLALASGLHLSTTCSLVLHSLMCPSWCA